MAKVDIQPNAKDVAEAAASLTAGWLTKAITEHRQATWVLAGQTTPLPGYELLARDYKTRVDWSNVLMVSGDERYVPFDSPDSNWSPISRVLLKPLAIPEAHQYYPQYLATAELSAEDFEKGLAELPKTDTDRPRFDVVWLGIGEDGHTLSLFPGHSALQVSDHLAVVVHDSPKPPADRVSLSLKALQNTAHCLILITGAGKATAVAKALAGDVSMPIVKAAQTIEAQGGKITWLLDAAAASQLPEATK